MTQYLGPKTVDGNLATQVDVKNSVLSGSGAPSSGLGINGDFYIDISASAIYGPKTAGAWGSATSLVGPAGPTGATGSTGPTGPAGDWSAAQTISAKTGAYTLVTADAGKIITVDTSSGVDVTVNGSLDLSAGQRIDLLQLGTGQVTVVASGATVNGAPGLKLRARYSAATLICTASDTYVLVGDIAA